MGVTLYSTDDTHSEIQRYITSLKSAVSLKFIEAQNVNALLRGTIKVHQNDMLILVLSRKGNVSHSPYFEALRGKMIKIFNENSLVFIYPETRSLEGADAYALETDGNLLEKGITLLKGAKGIFNKT